MARLSLSAALTLVVALLAAPAGAQTAAVSHQWSRGTELAVSAGAAFDDVHTGPMFAGIVGWSVTKRIAIEGRGAWCDRGAGTHGFEADLGASVRTLPGKRVAPYFGAGFGLYRASFDVAGANSVTDPAFRASGGVDLAAGVHVSIRPELSVVVVRRDGRTERLAMFGIRVGYRFEQRAAADRRAER